MRMATLTAVPALLLVTVAAHAGTVIEERIQTEYQPIRLVQVADGLEHPWAVAFLPDSRYLITERPGRLVLIDGETRTAVAGLPDIHARGQGGLLDVVLHPDYDNTGWIYMTYSRGDAGATVPALMRARLDGARLVDVEHLFESNEPASPGRHYGSRILFLADGTLLMSIGDRGARPLRAQDPLDHSGSLVRLTEDGGVPPDNPFVDDADHADEIYSYGHRNIQGMALHPRTDDVWVTEHGPRGGDELNRIEPGGNYGWPVVTRGRDYRTGEEFPDARARQRQGMIDPVFEILPTFAPSGLAIVSGARFSPWEGNLLAGGLRAQRMLRLVIEDEAVVHAEELLLHRVGRIRDVRQAPDGTIHVLSDEADGGLYRIEPADGR